MVALWATFGLIIVRPFWLGGNVDCVVGVLAVSLSVVGACATSEQKFGFFGLGATLGVDRLGRRTLLHDARPGPGIESHRKAGNRWEHPVYAASKQITSPIRAGPTLQDAEPVRVPAAAPPVVSVGWATPVAWLR